MKRIQTLIKLALLAIAAISLAILLLPVAITIPDLPPLEGDGKEDTGSLKFNLEDSTLESESYVATLFGWVAPKTPPPATPKPKVYTGPTPTPEPPIDAFIVPQNAKAVIKGKTSYLFKDIRINKTFWATIGEANELGWEIEKIQSDGFLMRHYGQRKIIKNPR